MRVFEDVLTETMNKQRLYWILQIGGWSVYGLFNLIVYYLSTGQFEESDFYGVLLQTCFYILSTHYFRLYVKANRWIEHTWLWIFSAILLANLLMGIANYVVLLAFISLSGDLVAEIEFRFVNVLLGFLGPAALYFVWTLIYMAYHYLEQYNQSLRYEAVLRDTELNYLRSQLNPHFIFNALNSIRALVDEDPKKSKTAITQLSAILRSSLQADKRKLVTLDEEMQVIRDYLSLEKIRFEERLEIEMEIDDDSLLVEIPPMMIQTLVENGIKHGVSKQKDGGFIRIETHADNESLIIRIRNTGVYLSPENKDEKYGLSNTHKRLELLFGESASLRIENEKSNVVLMEMILPKN